MSKAFEPFDEFILKGLSQSHIKISKNSISTSSHKEVYKSPIEEWPSLYNNIRASAALVVAKDSKVEIAKDSKNNPEGNYGIVPDDELIRAVLKWYVNPYPYGHKNDDAEVAKDNTKGYYNIPSAVAPFVKDGIFTCAEVDDVPMTGEGDL